MRAAHVALALAALAGGSARAQSVPGAPAAAAPYGAPVADEHVFVHGLLDEFEGRFGQSGNAFRWEGEAWAGTDEWRLYVNSEGEASRGAVSDGQTEAFLARPISSFFDLQAGARYDLDSGPGRAWAAIGVEGVAPYFFHVAAHAYVGEHGLAAKMQASYDQLLTNRLILEPEAEINLYSRNDPARKVGSGLSDLDAGLRLRYEIARKFAPYVGLAWEQRFGATAHFARAAGEPPHAVRLTLGLRSWF